jgi:hypothetical protein
VGQGVAGRERRRKKNWERRKASKERKKMLGHESAVNITKHSHPLLLFCVQEKEAHAMLGRWARANHS